MKKDLKKKLLIAAITLVIAVAIATGLEYLQVSTQPLATRAERPEATETLYPDGDWFEWAENMDDDSGTLIRTAEDPQLHFYTDPVGNIRTVWFEASEAPETDLQIQVFYGEEYMGYSEENSARSVMTAGNRIAWALIPEGTYQSLRIDIDGADRISGLEIAVSEREPAIEKVAEPLHRTRIAVIAAGIWILGWAIPLGFRCRKKEKSAPVRKENVLIGAMTFIGTAGAVFALLAFLILPKAGYPDFNIVQGLWCAFAGITAGSVVTFRRYLGTRPEIFFVIIALAAGSLMAVWNPTTPWVSWDDETHHMRALAFSYVDGARYTPQDTANLTYPPAQCTDLSDLAEYERARTELFESGASILGPAHRSPYDFWQIPAAIGLYLGRALHMGYDGMWRMGRLFSLFAYTLVGYFAIRRLRSGKMILTAVLLIPTALFLASNYSYDPGVTSLTVLGLSYLFAEWQEREEKLKWSRAVIMTVALTLGCLAKAVYCPMLILPLFLPRDKFRDKRQRRYFFGMVLSAVGLLLLSFILPLVTGSTTGDTRGGSDVSAGGQIGFILSDPLRYAGILIRFLLDYLSPAKAYDYITHLAYRGLAPGFELYLILLGLVTLTDRNDRDNGLGREKRWVRIPGHVLLFGAVVLCATAMYVSFTPVGNEGINGCQGRYLIPVLFPSLMMIGTGGLRLKGKRNLYNGAALLLIAAMNFHAVLYGTVGAWTL